MFGSGYGIFDALHSFSPYEFMKYVCVLESQGVDVDEFIFQVTPFDDLANYEDVMRELQSREAGYANWAEAQAHGAEDEVEATELLVVNCFSFDSLLTEALCRWFECDRLSLAKHLRSGYFDETTWHFYYVSGVGYNAIDADLLDGTGDGLARDKFEEKFDKVASK